MCVPCARLCVCVCVCVRVETSTIAKLSPSSFLPPSPPPFLCPPLPFSAPLPFSEPPPTSPLHSQKASIPRWWRVSVCQCSSVPAPPSPLTRASWLWPSGHLSCSAQKVRDSSEVKGQFIHWVWLERVTGLSHIHRASVHDIQINQVRPTSLTHWNLELGHSLSVTSSEWEKLVSSIDYNTCPAWSDENSIQNTEAASVLHPSVPQWVIRCVQFTPLCE